MKSQSLPDQTEPESTSERRKADEGSMVHTEDASVDEIIEIKIGKGQEDQNNYRCNARRIKVIVSLSLSFGFFIFMLAVFMDIFRSSKNIRGQQNVQPNQGQEEITDTVNASPSASTDLSRATTKPVLYTISPSISEGRSPSAHVTQPVSSPNSLPPHLIRPVARPVVAPSEYYSVPALTLAPLFVNPNDSPIHPSPTNNTSTSLLDRLSKICNPLLLQDDETPQGKAYQWISESDEKEVSHHDSFVVQRFILAAFYFATGGGRISATWSLCSAVPEQVTEVTNAFRVRCYFDDEGTICADQDDFIDCEQHADGEDVSMRSTSQNNKKRWLSLASECDWYGVECNPQGAVQRISLPSNSLVGSLVPELGSLTNLVSLDLRNNFLGGRLPVAWSSLGGSIEFLSLSNNDFDGFIPNTWYQWSNLKILDLGYNRLKGFIPSNAIEGWAHIQTLVLRHNHLNGQLPAGIWEMTQLEVLDVTSNKLRGSIPPQVGNLTMLSYLNIGECHFSGSVPPEIFSSTRLEYLLMNGNGLSGSLPSELWESSNLHVLNLQSNDFDGTISPGIGNLRRLQVLQLQDSGLTGEIPQALGDLTSLEIVHLQFNGFDGAVPQSLCDLEGLQELYADCDASQGQVECSCCTQCCSRKRKKCEEPSPSPEPSWQPSPQPTTLVSPQPSHSSYSQNMVSSP